MLIGRDDWGLGHDGSLIDRSDWCPDYDENVIYFIDRSM